MPTPRPHPNAAPPDAPARPAVAFGPFVLDPGAGQLRRDGVPVELAPRPWSVLLHLASRPGQLVSKDDLLDAVWGHRHVGDAALKVAINALRSRLGDNAAAPTVIATVSRRGYRFIAPLAAVAPARDDDLPRPGEPAPTRPVPAPTAPAQPARSAPGNLPPATPLLGRDADLAALRQQLRTQRLVTLLGPGGVGKTQLAIAAAGLDVPADGVWLVRMDGLTDGTPLVDTLARALNLGANAGRDAGTLAQALAPLAVRIVLDNAEHLVDALAPLVTRLLEGAPGLNLLVTSQAPLRVAGETLRPLRPLDVPGAGASAGPLQFPAVALFVERVRALSPGFEPDAAALADIAALCRLLDGLPLAIELAAARVPLLGTAGVRQRLEGGAGAGDRFALLSRGARDAPARHRTLRQALEWSFGLLDEPQRRVQRRLSVFSGSFTLAAACAVAAEPGDDGWMTLDVLQSLHEQSLLAVDASGDGHAERRFRQLESVRALAAEQLQRAGELGATQARLVEAMLAIFGQAQARYTRTPLLRWLHDLRPWADDLRQAMTHALARVAGATPGGTDFAEARRQALALFSQAMLFWLRSGRKREALRWFESVQPLAPGTDEPALRAPYGLALGALAAYAQSLPPAEALPWLDEAERQFAARGDARSAMLALYLHAAMRQRIAPHDDRTPLLARMRALEQPDWSARERNFAAWTAAVNAHGHGDLQAFCDFCADDLARAREAGDRAEAWVAAFGLGQALWSLGQRARAAGTLKDAVDDLRASGLLREYATTAALAASMRLALSLDDGAAADPGLSDALREAADLVRAEGMLWWMGDALMLLPLRRGDTAAALRLQRWMDARMRALGMKRSPVSQSLREAFDRLQPAPAASGGDGGPSGTDPSPDGASDDALEDRVVLHLAFG